MIFWILSVFWQTNWCINTYFIILWLTFYIIEVNLLVSIWIFGTKVNFKPPITQFEPLSCPNWFTFELVKSIPLCCWCYFLWFHRVISYFIDLWEKFLFKSNCLYLFLVSLVILKAVLVFLLQFLIKSAVKTSFIYLKSSPITSWTDL